MKISIILSFLFLIAGCGGQEQPSTAVKSAYGVCGFLGGYPGKDYVHVTKQNGFFWTSTGMGRVYTSAECDSLIADCVSQLGTGWGKHECRATLQVYERQVGGTLDYREVGTYYYYR